MSHARVHRCLILLLAAALLFPLGCDNKPATPGKIKLGFVVKQPEEPWFQLEWKFADEAAKKYDFELIKIGARDGEKALAALDTLGSSGAQGLVICTPDVKLGPALQKAAARNELKMIAVDDQFIGADGKPMTDVHYLGISARKIGQTVGQTLWDEMKRRNWPVEETGLCVVTFDELDTARERTEGAMEKLIELGFPKQRIQRAPQKTSDVPGSLDAVTALLTRSEGAAVKRWLVCGMNDSAVMGAVRAMEQRQIAPENIVGVGINGTDCIAEFEKSKPTGFHASVLLSAREHGYRTIEMLYQWTKEGKEPPKDTRTTGIVITRQNFQQVLKEQGIR